MESTSEHEQSTRSVENKGGDIGSDGHGHQKPSKSELLSSAKVMVDAARRRGENKVDKAEVAGAAANLLQAASEYGKLEDKSLGKYMEKAENHLRQYHNSHSTTNNSGTISTNNHPAGKDNIGDSYSSVNSGGVDHDKNQNQNHHQHQGGGGGKGKYDDYIKLAEGLAEGLVKKHSGAGGNNTTDTSSANSAGNIGGEHSGHSGSGSGYGQYVKIAGEFLKKH